MQAQHLAPPAAEVRTVSAQERYSAKIEILQGEQITPYLGELGKLFALYDVYPTYYQSTSDNTNHFVKIQKLTGHVVLIAKDPVTDKVIGFIPGNPLEAGYPRYLVAFPDQQFPQRTYHIRDLIVDTTSRNKGVGSQLYRAFEEHVKATGRYDQISVAITLRDDEFYREHPHLQAPPAPYEHAIWQKNGFTKYEAGSLYYTDWTIVGEDTPTKNKKQFWMKELK